MRGPALGVCYFCWSVILFVLWSWLAQTEAPKERAERPEPEVTWCSLVKEIDGSAGAPFVRRRLVADGAVLLSRLVPAAGWDVLRDYVRGGSPLGQRLARLFDGLSWSEADYPYLVSGYFLIWLSFLGFLLTCRWLVLLCYQTSAWVADATAFLLGFLLLGGADRTWYCYPYDIPNAFVFSLALGGILGARPWALPAFAVACYSKETALVLIPAYAWVHREELWSAARGWRCWAELAALALLYAVIRAWIARRFPQPPEVEFWFPLRNVVVLLQTFFHRSWLVAPAVVIAARVWLLRRELPPRLLVLLAGMASVMVGAAFFLGWIEERRSYLELLPLAGLIGLRWVLGELGLDHLIRARTSFAVPVSAAGVLSSPATADGAVTVSGVS